MVREDFEKRVSEVNEYFEIIKFLEYDKPKISAYCITENLPKEIIFDANRINILRSNAFLLLYNLVESTVFNSITSIFDAINSNTHTPQLKYHNLIDEVKKYWINNYYQHDEKIKKETVVNTFFDLANHIFENSITLVSNRLKYGGSIDAKIMEETARNLGVGLSHLKNGFDNNTHGEAFKQVKKHRNWLAHGDKSFVDIGKDYPYNQLNEWRKFIEEHLNKFIVSIEDYISNERYKKNLDVED